MRNPFRPGPTPSSASEEFAQSLPRTPLNTHLESLHMLLLTFGLAGEPRIAAEHHLREIALYTSATTPRSPWERTSPMRTAEHVNQARLQQAAGWDRAHRTICKDEDCKHTNPWRRS